MCSPLLNLYYQMVCCLFLMAHENPIGPLALFIMVCLSKKFHCISLDQGHSFEQNISDVSIRQVYIMQQFSVLFTATFPHSCTVQYFLLFSITTDTHIKSVEHQENTHTHSMSEGNILSQMTVSPTEHYYPLATGFMSHNSDKAAIFISNYA